MQLRPVTPHSFAGKTVGDGQTISPPRYSHVLLLLKYLCVAMICPVCMCVASVVLQMLFLHACSGILKGTVLLVEWLHIPNPKHSNTIVTWQQHILQPAKFGG